MNEKEKTTVPVPSVGADGEQSLSYVTEEIVTQEPDYFNFDDGKHGDEYLEQMLRMSEPSYLPTMTMNQVYETVYESRRPIIENLLYPGAYLFVGAPKVGKSFFMAQLAYHVSVGLPLWDYKTHPGTVLYLALEDDYRRIQERLYRMFGVDGTDNLHFATFAKSLATGLFEQLKRLVKEHPGTNLIIIDTLQKIREVNNDRYSYANDYEIIGQLKAFADESNLCLLIVHHTRKQQADDSFDRISGTNGLLGAADGAFIMEKVKRSGKKASIEVSGRDQPDQKLLLERDTETLKWELDDVERELWVKLPDPVLEKVKALVSGEQWLWEGTPTELVEALQVNMKPYQLTRYLNVNAGRLREEHWVMYSNTRTHNGRHIKIEAFHYESDDA